jgi:hypothetical protein
MNTFKAMPLHYACFTGNEKVIRLLIERGASFEDKDAEGRTPLEYFRLKEVGREVLKMYSEEMEKWKARRTAVGSGV